MSTLTVTDRDERLERLFAKLRPALQELGLAVSLWDRDGNCVQPALPQNELCQAVGKQGCRCREAMSGLVRSAATSGHPCQLQTGEGCGLLVVPVVHRRRMMGLLAACYPTLEMMAQPRLGELAARLRCSLPQACQMVEQACRHAGAGGGDMLRVVKWLLDRERAVQTANEELATLSTNLATTYEELSLLYRVSGSMMVNQQPKEFLQNVSNELLEGLNVCAVVAVLYGPAGSEADEELSVLAGQIDMDAQAIRALIAKDVAPRLAASGGALVDNGFAQSGRGRSAAVQNLIASPLMMHDQPTGLLLGLNKVNGEFDSIDLKLLNSIASQAGVFLANHRLFADLQDLLMGVLHALTATIDAKDKYTCGHSQRVALISRRLAEACGFDAERTQQVYLAGLLHDIGKIGVPESILCKCGRLTDEEFSDMKRHPTLAAKILGGIRQLDAVIPGILTHHERPDGKGYPQGLSGDQLPLDGRIIGLADSFDAMTSDRTYRKALPLPAVIEEIKRHAGTQFDEGLVAKFLAIDLEAFTQEIHQPARTVFPIGPAQEKTQ